MKLNEVSKQTLVKYIPKAAEDAINLSSAAAAKLAKSELEDTKNNGEAEDKKAVRRVKGIAKATKKLASESLLASILETEDYPDMPEVNVPGDDMPPEDEMPPEDDQKDEISVDVPLFIRMLEIAREEIKTDEDLHRFVERVLALKDRGVLTMDDYEDIMPDAPQDEENY